MNHFYAAFLSAFLLSGCASHLLTFSDEEIPLSELKIGKSERKTSFVLDIVNPSELVRQDLADACGGDDDEVYGYEVRTDLADLFISFLSLGILPSHTGTIYCK